MTRRIVLITGLVLAVLLTVLVANTLATYLGVMSERLHPAALSALLRPHDIIAKPPGDGPFPTALLFSGCYGVQNNLSRWSDMLVRSGWVTIVVDSHTPRALFGYDLWRLVCTGQRLPGAERAGDVLVSIADAKGMDFVDPNTIALIGMSHGGWAIMDLIALDPARALPFNLAQMPPRLADDPLAGIKAVVLVYPWCGVANRARTQPWTNSAPVLFVLAMDDIIAPAAECLGIARDLEDAGQTVELLTFEGVTHGFDQDGRSAYSPLVFAPEATTQSLAATAAFLKRAVPQNSAHR